MRPWLLAGAAGLAALAALAPRYHQAPQSRAQAGLYARDLAARLGWDITGWKTAVSAADIPEWRQARAAFSDSPLARWAPAVRYRVEAQAPDGQSFFRAEFGEGGQLLRFHFGGVKEPPALDAARFPELFAPAHAASFRRFEPGAGPRPDRIAAIRRREAKGGPKGRGGEGGFGGGRPEWEWIGDGAAPLALRIFALRPEGQLRGGRIDLEFTRALREQARPPGQGVRDGVQGFGAFLFVVTMVWAGWRVMAQIGVRRDYLRVLFIVWGVLAGLALPLFLLGGPGAILRWAGLGDSVPAQREGFGFLFGTLIGRPLGLALPLAAGVLAARGVHLGPWAGLLAACLRRRLPVRAAQGVWAGLAAAPAFAAIPYLVSALAPGPGGVSRPTADLLAHPFPVFEMLRRFPVDSLGGVLAFGLIMPWLLGPAAPSKLRYALFVLAGLVMTGQRMHHLDANGWAALASLPVWFFASWYVLRRAGLLGLLTAWLGSAAVTALAVYALAPGRFPLEILQSAALAAAPGFAAWAAIRRAPMPVEEEEEFTAEMERRNHPDTAPRLRSEREHLLSEFALARRAQEGMLPAHPPAAPGYSFAACCLPAREVGGDLFDFLELPGGRLGLCVADVSGKGVPAALYMTLTKGMLAAEQEMASSPRELARALNQQLLAAGRRRTFVTLVMGLLDPASGRVELVRAGHNPALWWRAGAGEGQFLMPRGIGLGLASDRLFESSLERQQFSLEPGDILALYSDGLTEAMDGARDLFGEDRLYHAIARNAHQDAPALLETLLAEVRAFTAGHPAHDDLTLLIVKRQNGQPPV